MLSIHRRPAWAAATPFDKTACLLRRLERAGIRVQPWGAPSRYRGGR